MRFIILTGMSGAGKSTALKMLEDMGYFCVDNLPVELIGKFAQFVTETAPKEDRNIALGIDIRGGKSLADLKDVLDEIKRYRISYEILFLDADDKVLIKRYKETRRNHPLSDGGRVEKGIRLERLALKFLKQNAEYIIDTTHLLTRDLQNEMEKIFLENRDFDNLMITILTFGFKYGIPEDADLVFDVRFLPNPYYVEELKRLTGNDPAIREYLLGFEQTQMFLEKLYDMIEFLLPNYRKEGKTHLVIAIGCTGGRHRSVMIAEALYRRVQEQGKYGGKLEHRDLEKDPKTNR